MVTFFDINIFLISVCLMAVILITICLVVIVIFIILCFLFNEKSNYSFINKVIASLYILLAML